MLALCEDSTFNMDVAQIRERLTPRTKARPRIFDHNSIRFQPQPQAIICVHTYHFPVDMELIA